MSSKQHLRIGSLCLGCADGITAGVLVPYEASCFQIVSESVPRQTASERCTSGGGTLGVLPTNASLTTVGNKVKTESESGVISSSVFWLGMNNTGGRILSENGIVQIIVQGKGVEKFKLTTTTTTIKCSLSFFMIIVW